MGFQRRMCPPPRRIEPQARQPLNQLWPALPLEERQRALRTLSRVVALQLDANPVPREVSHDET